MLALTRIGHFNKVLVIFRRSWILSAFNVRLGKSVEETMKLSPFSVCSYLSQYNENLHSKLLCSKCVAFHFTCRLLLSPYSLLINSNMWGYSFTIHSLINAVMINYAYASV